MTRRGYQQNRSFYGQLSPEVHTLELVAQQPNAISICSSRGVADFVHDSPTKLITHPGLCVTDSKDIILGYQIVSITAGRLHSLLELGS